MNNPEVRVTIFDTTARDGAQSLPKSNQFPDGSKYTIANEIARLGVGVIEAGFPRTPSDAEAVQSVARSIGQDTYQVSEWVDGQEVAKKFHTPIVAGLCRVNMVDIEAGWSAVQHAVNPRIHTFVSTDSHHRKAKFPGITKNDLIEMARQGVAYARSISADNTNATIEFSAEAASTTSLKYLEKIIRTALDEGADVINVPDTVGQKEPLFMQNFYQKIIGWVMKTNPDAIISAHNHNDLGMAVANTGMLVSAAAKWASKHQKTIGVQLETTICGIGERAGNADVFPCVANLFKFSPDQPVPIRWEFNPENSVRVAQIVMGLAGLTVGRQNPVVGGDIMRHRSGIHSDGILKGGHEMYTPFHPMFWGHEKNAIHEEGKYQGKAGAAAAKKNDT